jgi:hypothetical protein
MNNNILSGGLAGLILLAACASCEKSPREEVVLFAGSTTLVAGGRAVLTLLDSEQFMDEASGDTLTSARFSIRCSGQSHEFSARPGSWVEAPCGVRLRVNEVYQQTLPTVEFDIAWE